MRVTEATSSDNLFNGEVAIRCLFDECRRSSSITCPSGRAERTACLFQILSFQDGMMMISDIAAARIGYYAIGEKLTARQQTVRAIIACVAEAVCLPGHTNAQSDLINLGGDLFSHDYALAFLSHYGNGACVWSGGINVPFEFAVGVVLGA